MSPLEQARAALEPFADLAEYAHPEWDDDLHHFISGFAGDVSVRLHHIRAAAVALARLSALTPPDETEWARVVDPEAWTFEPWNENWTTVMVARRESALAKARTLIGMAK